MRCSGSLLLKKSEAASGRTITLTATGIRSKSSYLRRCARKYASFFLRLAHVFRVKTVSSLPKLRYLVHNFEPRTFPCGSLVRQHRSSYRSIDEVGLRTFPDTPSTHVILAITSSFLVPNPLRRNPSLPRSASVRRRRSWCHQ